jgi:ACS family hexuronate transporter-like MFS transporter
MRFNNHYRWRIIALLFFATTINYLDRSVISILAPKLQGQYGWSEADYGRIVASFQMAYGIGVVFAGTLLDRWGSRIVYAAGVALWSLAGIGHALVQTVLGFSAARFFLGLGESANFPAAVKTVAEWFPRKERALATGIFNAGSNIGAVVAPLLVPFIAIRYGWQWAFIITGILGLVWVLFWLKTYRLPAYHRKVGTVELAHIHSDKEAPLEKVSWVRAVAKRETMLICVARFLTDPVWWFLLYWLPKFLDHRYHVSLGEIGLPLVVIYVAADLGSIGGGWLSSSLIRKGWSAGRARKAAMLVCALCALPVVLISQGPGLWSCILLISLAGAAHQGWAANIFTVVSDIFPQNAVATVVGISTCAAVIGSMLAAMAIGWVLGRTGSYALIFSIAGCMYLAAWFFIRTAINGAKKEAA